MVTLELLEDFRSCEFMLGVVLFVCVVHMLVLLFLVNVDDEAMRLKFMPYTRCVGCCEE
jgi:hypothetical protein